MSKIGRNDPCPCGSGKKFKKCCIEKDKKRDRLKERVMKITRHDFISGPYKNCPNPKCAGQNSFGVFMPISGSDTYSRECSACGHQEHFNLPKIQKKVIYLDQFVISNLIKLLDKSHPRHQRIKSDPFWELLFVKLEKATKSQAIICPDSFHHRDESMVGGIEFKLMKRMYEHFSSGKTLYPRTMIEKNQVAHHFGKWLKKEKAEFEFKPEDIAFESELHSWSVGLLISVDGSPYPGQIESLQKTNSMTREQLKNIWKRWQSEKYIHFTDLVKEETLAFGRGLLDVAGQFIERRKSAMAKMTTTEKYEMDLDDLLPPASNDIIEALMGIARSEGLHGDRMSEAIIKYFNDADSLLEVPAIKISSVMFAGWARKAALGKKDPPKSTTDVQFISSYLPYCDALFVDKESAQILKEFPKDTPERLRLKEFKAKIFSLANKQEFLDYLDKLVADIPAQQTEILKDMEGENYFKPYWNIIEHEKQPMSMD